MAQKIAENTVAKRFTPICVAQINQDSKKAQKLGELKGQDFWDGQKFTAEQGWATIPGEEKPDGKVAEIRAKRLMES